MESDESAFVKEVLMRFKLDVTDEAAMKRVETSVDNAVENEVSVVVK